MSKFIASSVARKTVLDYNPPKIELGVPGIAMETYDLTRSGSTDFRISDVVRSQTGLNEIETTRFEEEVEKRTLEKLKEVQEAAYQEAYQLGLEEGRKEAFRDTSQHISEKMTALNELVDSITKLKTELLAQNERHLVQLAFEMAARVAAHEISLNPDATVAILRQAVEMAQSEEKIVVQVNPAQLENMELLMKETGREFEFLKKVKFEPNEALREGGCVVISNYGEVDSRTEERVKKLWAGLEEVLPKTKDKITAA